ncbi:hypothetical protein DPEC_G00123250 [Dallia pectoralis]|uniref:Uncharacterized protein n=1 Tax=Dallia pectoralis TaxID=75939 RepID=A0ACC2GQY5_DALPE|nr:hypothetical protein DPEC_G00123250 [Dallia pectoralis]
MGGGNVSPVPLHTAGHQCSVTRGTAYTSARVTLGGWEIYWVHPSLSPACLLSVKVPLRCLRYGAPEGGINRHSVRRTFVCSQQRQEESSKDVGVILSGVLEQGALSYSLTSDLTGTNGK